MLNEEFANYFNYFTEIEEHFQRARGTGLFLLSPLDWALIETWKDAGVPLEAVLLGIDDEPSGVVKLFALAETGYDRGGVQVIDPALARSPIL